MGRNLVCLQYRAEKLSSQSEGLQLRVTTSRMRAWPAIHPPHPDNMPQVQQATKAEMGDREEKDV